MMRANAFRDSRLKIQRANEHIADIQAHLRMMANEYVLRVYRESDTGRYFIEHGIPNGSTIPDKLPLIIGDAVHNLKCALDFAWMETISIHAPAAVDDKTTFPVYPSRNHLEGALIKRKIHIASHKLFDTILNEIQPYKGGNDTVWAVHSLDIPDKHKHLIPSLGQSIANIELEDDAGCITWLPLLVGMGACLYRVQIEPNIRIKSKGKPCITVLFDKGTIIDNLDVCRTLAEYSEAVLGVVETLESI